MVFQFPLIQLPRKSEGNLGISTRPRSSSVSINSTSEEVRRFHHHSVYWRVPIVSINSTSEEVRSFESKAGTLSFGRFPLIQLPRKSEDLNGYNEGLQAAILILKSNK